MEALFAVLPSGRPHRKHLEKFIRYLVAIPLVILILYRVFVRTLGDYFVRRNDFFSKILESK